MTSGETAYVDMSKFHQRLGELADALHIDTGIVLQDEARMFLKQAIKLSPPARRLQGEEALARDLHRIFDVSEDPVAQHIADDFGTDHIRHWMTAAGGQREFWQWDKLDVHGYGMEQWHKAHLKPTMGHRSGQTVRIRFGQKNKGAWVAPYVVSASAFLNYFKLTAKKVGTLKAAWGICFEALGGKLPNWIHRNIGRRKGFYQGDTQHPTHPFILMINRADGVSNTTGYIRTAVRLRTNAMSRRLKLIASGYGRDITEKLRVNHKAFITPDSMNVPE